MMRVRYSFRAKAGLISLMQAGRDDLWRLRFGGVEGTEYSAPEGAIFALANRTTRLPGGLSFDDWWAPPALGRWKRELVDDLPPRPRTDEPDEW